MSLKSYSHMSAVLFLCCLIDQRWWWDGTTVTLGLVVGYLVWISTHSRALRLCQSELSQWLLIQFRASKAR